MNEEDNFEELESQQPQPRPVTPRPKRKSSRELNSDEPKFLIHGSEVPELPIEPIQSEPKTPLRLTSHHTTPRAELSSIIKEHLKQTSSARPKSTASPSSTKSAPKSSSKPETEEEKIYQLRLEFWKVKKDHPDIPIPNIENITDLAILQNTHTKLVKAIKGKKNRSINSIQYSFYLIVYFSILEWAAVNIIGEDARGFADFELKNAIMYQHLLEELGEMDYGSFCASWRPEFRLGLMGLVNLIIFCFVKKMLGGKQAEKVIGGIKTLLYTFNKPTPEGKQQGEGVADMVSNLGGLGQFITPLIGKVMGKNEDNLSEDREVPVLRRKNVE